MSSIIFPSEKQNWGLLYRLTENKKSSVRIITLNAGQQTEFPPSEEEKLWFALDPGLMALIGEESFIMKDKEISEEGLFIPKGTHHSLKNVSIIYSASIMEISLN